METRQPSPQSSIIPFLAACFDADNRQAGITNLFHKSLRHVYFLDGEERLLSGWLRRVPIAADRARPAQADSHMYRREKSLFYCALPMIGPLPARGLRPATTLCAPLLVYPAKLDEQAGEFTLEIDLSQRQLNWPILEELAAQQAGETDLEELIREFPLEPLAPDGVHALIALLQDFFPRLDALPLQQFPKLEGAASVRQAMRQHSSAQASMTCLPACAMALAPNSQNARGVLFELEQLANSAKLSAPLRSVLMPPTSWSARPRGTARVPAVLSRAQQAIVNSAASAPLTLAIGPPGTGKTFTIAAIAVDHIARGESALIACRKSQALDVAAKLLNAMLGRNQCVIRGGQSQHVRELKKFLSEILQGIRLQIRTRDGSPDSLRRIETRLAALDRGTQRRESALIRQLEREVRWGDPATQFASNWWNRWLRDWRLRWIERQLSNTPPLWDAVLHYTESLQAENNEIRELLKQRIDQRMQRTLKEHRRDLSRFLDSLRTRSSARQEKLFSQIDPGLLFKTFPVWLTTVTEAAELVPLEAEPFDVAIIDEATQCDMASCLPILQRAKRAVIVGDPNQLRHISFLSRERLQLLADRYELDADQRHRLQYRDKSLLDLVNEGMPSQEHVHFLNEHFRSLPQIIRFSNARFYHNALSVMRQSPKSEALQCVTATYTPLGKKVKGVNELEAQMIADELAERVRRQAALPDSECQSLGVLSPFRDQVDRIAQELEQRLPLSAFERHDIRVGTAHGFQGDERDVMWLSFAIDNQAHHTSMRFLNNSNLLNVAITRARQEQFVYYSIATDKLPADSLLRQYLESLGPPAVSRDSQPHVADTFLNDVRESLTSRGMQIWSAYELAGVMIDLVIHSADRILGIDLVGHPGRFAHALDIERYRILGRAGFAVVPLAYRDWTRDKQACIDAICQRLESIQPCQVLP